MVQPNLRTRPAGGPSTPSSTSGGGAAGGGGGGRKRGGRSRNEKLAIAWIVLACLTCMSAALPFLLGGPTTSSGSSGSGSGGSDSSASPDRAASQKAKKKRKWNEKSDELNYNELYPESQKHLNREDTDPNRKETNYALLYPQGSCKGDPVRIPYSSKEEGCSHCADLCRMRFPGMYGAANLAPQTSIVVYGSDYKVDIAEVCLGAFPYLKEQRGDAVQTIRAGDGCVDLKQHTQHVRFV